MALEAPPRGPGDAVLSILPPRYLDESGREEEEERHGFVVVFFFCLLLRRRQKNSDGGCGFYRPAAAHAVGAAVM